MPYKGLIMAVLISPMIVPLIISGVAIFFFMAKVGLAATHTGIIFAHMILDLSSTYEKIVGKV